MANTQGFTFSVFTKPWPTMALPELGKFVKGLGFDAVELPVRPGFQVLPENVARDLPKAAKQLADCGVTIASVAGPTDEQTIAACAEAGVPTIRVMVNVRKAGYLATEAKAKAEYQALVPLLDRYHVQIGVQNHCDDFIANAAGLLHLMEGFDPKHVAAVYDAAHCALNGEDPELAIDIIWSHLCMVNLKNAIWRRTNGPEAEIAKWEIYWTTGRQGLSPWSRVAAELKRRNWRGVLCLTAEYSDEPAVERLIAEDIAFAKSLFL
ncbi:MAG: sugar phosphate isomerase/epimerase family protein [Armatimonadota bacterium]